LSVSTSCKSCCFARVENGEQVGCEAGRLELFVKAGARVEQVEGGDSRFFLVHDRVCMMSRHSGSPWAAQTPPAGRLEKARSEARPRLHVVIYVGPDATVEDALRTVASAEAQGLPVSGIHLTATAATPGVRGLVRAMNQAAPKSPWNVRACARKPGGKPAGRGAAVDEVVNFLAPADCSHYLAVDAGAELWPTLLPDLDKELNERLGRFLLLTPLVEQDGETRRLVGPLCQTSFHQAVGGNAEAFHDRPDGTSVPCHDVADKARLMAAGSPHLLKSLGDVCPPG
jgi:hypothetical protein